MKKIYYVLVGIYFEDRHHPYVHESKLFKTLEEATKECEKINGEQEDSFGERWTSEDEVEIEEVELEEA